MLQGRIYPARSRATALDLISACVANDDEDRFLHAAIEELRINLMAFGVISGSTYVGKNVPSVKAPDSMNMSLGIF